MKSSHEIASSIRNNESEYNNQNTMNKTREIIQILRELGNIKATYPPEHLDVRRAAFLEHAERVRAVELDDESSAEHQEILKLLGQLKWAQVDYPAELLAARRSAFVRQLETAGRISLFDQLRGSLQRIFPAQTTRPTSASAGLRRFSPAIAGLVATLLIGALFLSRAEQTFPPLFLNRLKRTLCFLRPAAM